MSAALAGRLIALDWGTSTLRGYLLSDDGAVLDRRAEPWGILEVPERDFAGALASLTAAWRAGDAELPAIASGMIGSAQGWVEAPYVDAPAGADLVAQQLVPVPGTGLRIVPGIAQRGAAPDVMRGEETQLFGAMIRRPDLASGGVAILPGTHSKWARVADGRIERFTTYMTGELFAVLRRHSILGRLAPEGVEAGDAESPAFLRGVRQAYGASSGLAGVLFSARSAVLVGDLQAGESLEYLSGLLIGDEIRAGLASGARPSAIVGDARLCARYASALAAVGAGPVAVLEDTAPAGLWEIARRAMPELQRAGGPSRRTVSGRVL